MVFNLTSCVRGHRRGFTLVEYLIATSIGLVVMTVALVFWAYASRTCASLLGYVDLSTTSKNALATISQQIRNAKAVQSCSEQKLVLVVPGSTGTNIHTVTYVYSPATKVVREAFLKNGMSLQLKTLLTECTNFQFSVFQRTPQSNSFQLYTNAWNTNTAKVVNMRWTCVRKLTGDKDTVETSVSANVVIRNK